MKEVEGTANKWKDTLCSWIEGSNIVKMTILPRQSTGSMQSLSKYQSHLTKLDYL